MDPLEARAAGPAATEPDPLELAAQNPYGTHQELAYGGQPLQTPGATFTAAGFLRGLKDPWDASAQLLHHAIPALDMANNWLASKGVPVTPNLDQSLQADEKAYQASRGPMAGTDVGRLTGSMVPGAAVGGALGALGVGSGAVAAMPIRAAMAGGGVNAALSTPVTDGGNFWGEKAAQTGVGAVAGGLGTLGMRTAGAVVGPQLSRETQMLLDEGVRLTPGQIAGGGALRAEQGATSIPITGDMIRNRQRQAFTDLNTAAYNRVLEPLGERFPNGVPAGRDAIAFLDDKIGHIYDNALSGMPAVPLDHQFQSSLNNVQALVRNLPQANQDQFSRIVSNELQSRVNPNGYMTPQAWKAADSNIGGIIRSYSGGDADQRVMANALRQVQADWRDMLSRNAPPAQADAISAANAAYARFLRVERASSSLGAENGVFTPEQLDSAVKALTQGSGSSGNKRAYARGEALLQDLSGAGKTVMGSKVPDSGTPFRSMMSGNLLSQSSALISLPAAVGYTPGAQAFARALMAGMQGVRRPVGDALRTAAPYVGLAGAPAVSNASNQRP